MSNSLLCRQLAVRNSTLLCGGRLALLGFVTTRITNLSCAAAWMARVPQDGSLTRHMTHIVGIVTGDLRCQVSCRITSIWSCDRCAVTAGSPEAALGQTSVGSAAECSCWDWVVRHAEWPRLCGRSPPAWEEWETTTCEGLSYLTVRLVTATFPHIWRICSKLQSTRMEVAVGLMSRCGANISSGRVKLEYTVVNYMDVTH